MNHRRGKDYIYGPRAGLEARAYGRARHARGNQRLIICNGYKDTNYIRLAAHRPQARKRITSSVEQLSELDDIIRLSGETGVKPMIGFRRQAPDARRGQVGHLHRRERQIRPQHRRILSPAKSCAPPSLSSCLRLVHFHVGSQVPNIITIKNAVIEATRFYLPAREDGFPMGYLDVGGGLGIDYDGSRTISRARMNYSMESTPRRRAQHP